MLDAMWSVGPATGQSSCKYKPLLPYNWRRDGKKRNAKPHVMSEEVRKIQEAKAAERLAFFNRW